MIKGIDKYYPDLIIALISRNICLASGCTYRSFPKLSFKGKKHEQTLLLAKSRLLCEECITKDNGIEMNRIALKKYAKQQGYKFE